MRVALLNLISTPAAVLPTLGLELAMGLSSEDPMVERHPSEPYDAYLSVYAPDGTFARRLALGQIPPHRRGFFLVSKLLEPFGFQENHLVVAHRVPRSLTGRSGDVAEPVELPDGLDYGFFRAYVQYAYPGSGGAHGGLVYEIPHRFNEPLEGRPSPVVLTFTTKIVLSDVVSTSIVLIHCSTDPGYTATAHYAYAIHAGDGSRVAVGQCAVPAFAVRVLDLRALIPHDAVLQTRDPQDGLSHFCLYGICEDAAVAVLVLNLAPALNGVSIEHTHPTQGYLMPFVAEDRQRLKRQAVAAWRDLIQAALNGGGG